MLQSAGYVAVYWVSRPACSLFSFRRELFAAEYPCSRAGSTAEPKLLQRSVYRWLLLFAETGAILHPVGLSTTP